jgi:hypothetical protein
MVLTLLLDVVKFAAWLVDARVALVGSQLKLQLVLGVGVAARHAMERMRRWLDCAHRLSGWLELLVRNGLLKVLLLLRNPNVSSAHGPRPLLLVVVDCGAALHISC